MKSFIYFARRFVNHSLSKLLLIISAQGKPVDATQEIIALGVCNLVSSFFQSIPVNGSFSRSAVSNASGVKTPGSGIYTGMLFQSSTPHLLVYFESLVE